MIKVENLSYSFPNKDLYNNISFTLELGQHCAFIGASGSGKSTLIDIIMNPEKRMFDGNLDIIPDCKIEYVGQFYEADKTEESTVFDYIAEEFIKLQNQLALICTEMETATELDELLEKYQKVLDSYDAIGGDDYESNINKQLNLADIMKIKDLSISKVSGGEFKLIQVIKIMLRRPDLIVMDEPDVFLDFENINSLKSLINSHKGTLLIITQNRYLLNNCFDKIIHLENLELQEFDGKYIEYNFSLLLQKIELQELANVDSEEVERNEVLIDKLRDIATTSSESSRGKSLNARVKIQERLRARRIKSPFVYIKQPTILLEPEKNLEDTTILKVDNYSVAFDDILLENISFEIKSTDKVALIGPNGTGKTTLLRDIFKNNHKTIEINEDIKVSYLSQLQSEMLNESNTIVEEFFDNGFDKYDEIISYIADYGFEGEGVNQKIKSLSGGEKSLIQLAKIAAKKSNLLLLDEPTSHLDTYSQIALEKAIESYKGGIIMISHDFYSIVNSMDYVLLIENKTIRKTSVKKFKKMIYAKHFDRDYLEIEQSKIAVELKIALALESNDFELAKGLCKELEELIVQF